MATGKATTGSVETATITGTGTNNALVVNGNYLPFTDSVNYYSANSHVLRNLGGTSDYAVVDSSGVTTAAFNMLERTDPDAPAANSCVVYAKDNGAGKTQLVVRFPTGAVQVLATEP